MTKKRQHSIMPYSVSQNAVREEQRAVLGVVYYEVLSFLVEYFQLLKNSLYIHKYKDKESMDWYI